MQTVRQLYEDYEHYIFRYLYGLTMNHHLAEELTQETFFQVVKSVHRFRGDSHVTTWLYKIARHVYNRWRRKNPSAASVPLDEATLLLPVKEEPPNVMEQKERQRLIREVLQELPEGWREVLWLREWQELSYAEISVVTGRSLSWVKVNIQRARHQFRKLYLEKEGS